MQRTAKLAIRIVEGLSASAPKEAVAVFSWDDREERAQSDSYDCRVGLQCCAAFLMNVLDNMAKLERVQHCVAETSSCA